MILPGLAMVTLGASSQSPGLLLVLGIIFCIGLATKINLRRLMPVLHTITPIMALVLLLGTYSNLRYQEFAMNRFILTYTYLLIYLTCAAISVQVVDKTPNYCIDFAVKLSFYLVLSCIVLTICGFGNLLDWDGVFNKPSLLFVEPSHIAGGFSPLLLYLCAISSLRKKAILFVLAFASCIAIENTTLLFSCIVVAALTLPFRLFSLLICVVSLYLSLNSEYLLYHISRVDMINSSNGSLVLYISGWERTYLSFMDSCGLGIGFQQFGIIGSKGEILADLDLWMQEVTLLGGSSVAMKFIAEFGIFALFVIFWYLFHCARIAIWFRRISLSKQKSYSAKIVFLKACFVLYFVDLFVRGTGYFSSTAFLFMVSALWIRHSSDSRSSLIQLKN
jgi:hypothetical protein